VTVAVQQVLDQAIKEKLPLLFVAGNVKRACLATYAADYSALGKQAAALAEKIFKGIKPSELPIELPYKLNLVLNLQTVKAVDLKIAKEILLRADQVFE
jgi:putative tryptophan/tyrosine transport system substrate-binding protein